ncbi:hypothetical protein [Massilia sp. CF038]|uniref:hypothetical protein n=1 Tax=Massilia sp. CF038 TaxID=1881045 RepID=UPI00091335F3|nr:hypothetical protein [Massilia sp. CF038]SHG37828.1 hypothetical protein SAMN05428948_0159 [Massilia sp. CF038]
MGIEYSIQFLVPENFNSSALLNKLPSPISHVSTLKIYEYAFGPDGFYSIDHLVNRELASLALRVLIDEALSHSVTVQIVEP